MKLVCISHIIKDEKFLVELIEEQLTLEALIKVIEDRGTNPLSALILTLKRDLLGGIPVSI
jgi:hypothetical protein